MSAPDFMNALPSAHPEPPSSGTCTSPRSSIPSDIDLEAAEINSEGFSKGVDRYTIIYSHELTALIRKPYFGKFANAIDVTVTDFDSAVKTIQETAPALHTLLMRLLPHPRTLRASSGPHDQPKKLQSQTSEYLSSMLEVHLNISGVKRQVIDTLSGLGLYHGYDGGRLAKQSANQEKKQMFSIYDTVDL
ncbi:hypothetical protein BBP40_012646 [Aspergillus hancockii]|nr:hypothetical protein BBP40_012646 [Aspergillus hancockii]